MCTNCGKNFCRVASKLKNSKSGLAFCSRGCKDKSQRLGGISAIMPAHYGTSNSRNSIAYRRLYKDFYGVNLICWRCNYQEFECGLDIHHIDGNPLNNEKKNLICLCACCHRGLHNKRWELKEIDGELAQLGERFAGCEKVIGSTPIFSTE